jgi:predicted GIY-YIG superfamily endonuclease
LDNLEYAKQYAKQYYLSNPDPIKQRAAQHRLNNPEHHKEYSKQHRLNNPEYYRKKAKQYKESLKDGLHRVYLLPNEKTGYGYIGTTDCIPTRMKAHKFNGKNTSNMMIVRTFEDRDKALEFESFMHDQGYEGRHIKNLYK